MQALQISRPGLAAKVSCWRKENLSLDKVNTCMRGILSSETGLCVRGKTEKILQKFSLLWTGRNKLAWCLHLLLYGHRWTGTPHPVQSPAAYSFLLQTHSPGGKHEQLNKIKIQICEKPTERIYTKKFPKISQTKPTKAYLQR